MIVAKPALSAVPLHPLLAERWSGRAFEATPVAERDLTAILEAARWAPSSRNEQPWRIVAVRPEDETRAATEAALAAGNQWARRAPLLLVVSARSRFAKDGTPNRYAWHDTGIATAQMLAEASALGLATHVMGGFHAEPLRAAVGIPDGDDPVTVIAIGHRAAAETLPEDLRARELAPRSRHPLETVAFRGRFGAPPADAAAAEAARGAA